MRAIWSGAIALGAIYIPVRLYNATRTRRLPTNLFRRDDFCRVTQKRFCADTGEEVREEEIVRGYEYEKGKYVPLEAEDFQRVSVGKSRVIQMLSFTDPEEIDLRLLERPYYLAPADGAENAYALLRDALEKTGKVGIARFVLRDREHLGALLRYGDVMALNQMRFASDVDSPDTLPIPHGEAEVPERELRMAVELINVMSEPFKPELYHDVYMEDLKRVIDEKITGQQLPLQPEQPIPVEVGDLFAKLRESLEMAHDRDGRAAR